MSDFGQSLERPARPKGPHRLAKGTRDLSPPGCQALERRTIPLSSPGRAPAQNGQPLIRDVQRRTAIDGTPGIRGNIVRPISLEVTIHGTKRHRLHASLS